MPFSPQRRSRPSPSGRGTPGDAPSGRRPSGRSSDDRSQGGSGASSSRGSAAGRSGGAGRAGSSRGDGGAAGAGWSGRGRAANSGRNTGAGGDRPVRRQKTTAEQRSAEVKLRRPRRDELAVAEDAPVKQQPDRPDRWIPEKWQDEGPLREAAERATARARRPGTDTAPAEAPPAPRERRGGNPAYLDPDWIEEVKRESDPRTSARYMERLAAATEALERDRYRDALRMVSSVLKNLPNVGAAHEVAGIAHYRLGEWRKAATEMELARGLHPTPEQLPVLADCYRALRRYREVEQLWSEIRETSPSPEVMAEGRIVAAGALADQGDIDGALRIMLRVSDAPKRVREYHLKQWYVIGDLYDRSGDVTRARNFFKRVAAVDARYADVGDRLATLGRR